LLVELDAATETQNNRGAKNSNKTISEYKREDYKKITKKTI